MNNISDLSRDNYNAVLKDIEAYITRLQNEPNMPNTEYKSILKSITKLNTILKMYSDKMWHK